MLKHIKNKCLSLNKTEKIYQQKDTKFTCILEEDIAVYFTKLHKQQELLKKVGINWDDFAEIHAGDQINLLQLTVQQVKDDQLGGKIEYEQNMG